MQRVEESRRCIAIVGSAIDEDFSVPQLDELRIEILLFAFRLPHIAVFHANLLVEERDHDLP